VPPRGRIRMLCITLISPLRHPPNCRMRVLCYPPSVFDRVRIKRGGHSEQAARCGQPVRGGQPGNRLPGYPANRPATKLACYHASSLPSKTRATLAQRPALPGFAPHPYRSIPLFSTGQIRATFRCCIHAASHVRCAGARVMPGVRTLRGM
jgi:hypothetical protein